MFGGLVWLIVLFIIIPLNPDSVWICSILGIILVMCIFDLSGLWDDLKKDYLKWRLSKNKGVEP